MADRGDRDTDIEDVLDQLEELERTVDSGRERQEVRHTRRMLERLPGSNQIRKYTGRDVAEGFVGGVLFALPLLVEDGVFAIAEWFVSVSVGPVPVFLVVNVAFITSLVSGLLYYTDIRSVQERPLFGFVPRRLIGTLLISLTVAVGMMFLWGRLEVGDPTPMEALARITVIWAAAALGTVLGDILPGESDGEDLSKLTR